MRLCQNLEAAPAATASITSSLAEATLKASEKTLTASATPSVVKLIVSEIPKRKVIVKVTAAIKISTTHSLRPSFTF